jgi:acetyl esterase
MIDPELKPFLEMWDKAWSVLPPNATAPDRRAMLEKLSDEARQPLPDGVTSEERWASYDGRSVRVLIFRHEATSPAPCLVYMHGGGWMQGSPETHDAITTGIAHSAHYTVISVDYSLAPEHPFPAALHDCEAVVKWVFENAADLGIREDHICVGGDSAGANLAAALTLVFRGTSNGVRGQVLFYPAVDYDMSRPSFRENAEGPIIKTSNMGATLEDYCPDRATRMGPLVSPIRADDHTGLPPAFIAVAEHDPLRDDGVAYAERLMAAGVPVVLDRGTGLIHGYLRATPYAAASRAGLEAACAWLRDLAVSRRRDAAE